MVFYTVANMASALFDKNLRRFSSCPQGNFFTHITCPSKNIVVPGMATGHPGKSNTAQF
jgi:hypothetical protein